MIKEKLDVGTACPQGFKVSGKKHDDVIAGIDSKTGLARNHTVKDITLVKDDKGVLVAVTWREEPV